MLRRDPKTIVMAHTMDPARKELYVEGPRDRTFLEWLMTDRKDPNAVIVEISAVNINVPMEGERGRLMAFARWIGERPINILFFADADFDRLLRKSTPIKVLLTDARDLEGYTLQVKCLDKVLKLGVPTDAIKAKDVLEMVYKAGRLLGLLRILSVKRSVSLPFQHTKLRRYLSFKSGYIKLDFDAYLKALMQNAKISLLEKPQILVALREIETEFSDVPTEQIIHGKDAFCIIEEVLSHFGVAHNACSRMMWISFEYNFVVPHSNLDRIRCYLETS